jgi:hypothetical protein
VTAPAVGAAVLTDMATSAGDPRDMAAAQVAAVRKYVLDDLFAFATVVFGYRDLDETFHRELCALLGAWGQPGYRRLMVQVPRGTFKTSVGTIANSLWQTCRDPDAPIAIFNEKEDNAAMWVRAIRETVQNSIIFQTLFPELLPPGISARDRERGITMPRSWKWTDSELLFQRGSYGTPEPSIMGLGIGSASAGRHWPKIIKDDLLSEDAKNSPLVMTRAKDWVDNSFSLEKPALGGQDLIMCTPWHYDDAYAHALRQYDYKLYRRGIYDGPDGSILTPKLFTRATLDRMQQADPYTFSAQQLCRPRPGKEVAFEFAWLRFGEVRGDTFAIEPPSFDATINPAAVPERPTRNVALAAMEKCILVDPIPDSATERNAEPGCRHAVVVLGQDYFGRKYLLDVWVGRVDPLDLINTILAKCGEWAVDRVGIEKVAFSVVYRHWLREEARRRGVPHLSLIDLEPGRRQKDARIRAKITPTRLGVWYVNRAAEREFVREYLEFPYGGTRDILDAWAYDDEPGVLPRPLSPEEAARYDELQDAQSRIRAGADEITGY